MYFGYNELNVLWEFAQTFLSIEKFTQNIYTFFGKSQTWAEKSGKNWEIIVILSSFIVWIISLLKK